MQGKRGREKKGWQELHEEGDDGDDEVIKKINRGGGGGGKGYSMKKRK